MVRKNNTNNNKHMYLFRIIENILAVIIELSIGIPHELYITLYAWNHKIKTSTLIPIGYPMVTTTHSISMTKMEYLSRHFLLIRGEENLWALEVSFSMIFSFKIVTHTQKNTLCYTLFTMLFTLSFDNRSFSSMVNIGLI